MSMFKTSDIRRVRMAFDVALPPLELSLADDAGVDQLLGAGNGAVGELELGVGFEIGGLKAGQVRAVNGGEDFTPRDDLAFHHVEVHDAASDGRADARHARFVGFDAAGHLEGAADVDDGGLADFELGEQVRAHGDFERVGRRLGGLRLGVGATRAAARKDRGRQERDE